MERRRAWPSVAVLLLAGCGLGQGRPPVAEGALPIDPEVRFYFESSSRQGHAEVTVSVTSFVGDDDLTYELECGHIEPARALARPTTGIVDADTLASGHDVYGIDCCERRTDHAPGALPAFLVSRHTMTALEHHERTVLRMDSHTTAVALMPLGHETLRVRVDGRPTDVLTLHARGDGVELWIADVGTPIVVREVDHERGFALAAIDTGATPRARP